MLLEVKNIKKSYKKTVLKDINFSTEQGHCIGIIGENGCGKSTFLEIISGVLFADSGTILFDGKEALKDKKLFKQYTAFVPQENPIIEELTVKDNLLLWYGFNNFEKVLSEGIPFKMGLKNFYNQSSGSLSGGMKKRLSIACALSQNSSILILDEPTAALDLICKNDIYNYLQNFVENKGTVIITTHDEKELDLCDKIYVLKEGILSEIPKDLRGNSLINMLA